MRRPPIIVMILQAILLFECVTAVLSGRPLQVFIPGLTLAISFAPYLFEKAVGIRLPSSFIVAIVVFVFATLFLGEVEDFYNKYWWWDTLLHFSSALSFGVIAFLFIFMLFEGDRYAAPPWAIGLLSACVALSIGAIWEIFEYAMDQFFGTNMQKSGLPDTMKDIIVDTLGAIISGTAGAVYLQGRHAGGIWLVYDSFLKKNRKLYRKFRRRPIDD